VCGDWSTEVCGDWSLWRPLAPAGEEFLFENSLAGDVIDSFLSRFWGLALLVYAGFSFTTLQTDIS